MCLLLPHSSDEFVHTAALLPGDKLLEKSRRLLRQFVENDILCPAAASGVAAAAGDLEFIQQAAAEGATLDKNVGYLAAAGKSSFWS